MQRCQGNKLYTSCNRKHTVFRTDILGIGSMVNMYGVLIVLISLKGNQLAGGNNSVNNKEQAAEALQRLQQNKDAAAWVTGC